MRSKNNKTVCVLGLGYIGLPTLIAISNKNFKVIGIDSNKKVISNLKNEKTHIREPNIDNLFKKVIKNKNVFFSSVPKKGDIYIICVPTPLNISKKIPSPDMRFVFQVIKDISKFLKRGDMIILESTSPVGTTEKIKDFLISQNIDINGIHISYCPERVLPGNIFKELINNDRIIGSLTSEGSRKTKEFYKSFVKGKIYETDAKTAELCKLTENSFRDVNIAFANELSLICDKENIDVWKLIEFANKHPRVNVLDPGCGVGGHCIAVDPWFIVDKDKKNSKLIKTSRKINENKRDWVARKIESSANYFYKKNKKIPKIAIYGLSYKADIDDLRESPSVYIAENLKSKGHKISIVEPNVKKYKNFKIKKVDESLKTDDLIVILVKHKEFKNLSKAIKKDHIYLDFCNALNQK